MSHANAHSAEISDQNEALRRENADLYAQIKALSQRLAQGSAGPGYPLELVAGLRTLEAPMSVMADSYKAGHFLMYPECKSMTAYGEFREPMKGMMTDGKQDNRFVFYGMRHYIENFVSRKWTKADVDAADAFYKTHAAGGKQYPFPKDLFLKFINENDGYFPVTIEALPEGTVAYIHTPVFIISAENEYSRLCTFLETILTMGFNKSVDEDMKWLLDSRLHDFGFRGCTSVEQSVLGGSAHLLSFEGSDTMSACYHVQFHLNGGKPVASSIPATEHSVMTAWPTEEAAINNEIEHFGGGLFACVMDSYDYDAALDTLLPKVAGNAKAKGGLMVLRPDSGDPVTQVIKGLKAAEKCFGVHTNGKGFKCIEGAAVIQGDGINYDTVRKIQEAVLAEGYSSQNVAYGMGGALLQKLNRDTMSFATKLCHITYASGESRDVMKTPKSSAAKTSLPGQLFVGRSGPDAPPIVFPKGDPSCKGMDPAMQIVYNKRPVPGVFEDFSTVRDRVNRQWQAVPPNGNPMSEPLQNKINDILRSRGWTI